MNSMTNVGVIDVFLNTFTTYIDSGFGLIKGEVGYLSSTLIVIDITLAGLFWAWGSDEDILRRLVRKTLYIGFFAYVIGNFNALAAILFNSFAGLGLKAGGSTLAQADFLRPGRLAEMGLDAGQGRRPASACHRRGDPSAAAAARPIEADPVDSDCPRTCRSGCARQSRECRGARAASRRRLH